MGASASRPEPPAHRSLNCRTATVVEFLNDTPFTVAILWIDYSGGERRYFSLPPGGWVRQPTFTAHPWRFAPLEDPAALCVVADQAIFYPPPLPEGREPAQVHIHLAAPLPWCPAAHATFPPAFRAQAAALLACWHRLASAPGVAAAAAAQAPLSPRSLRTWLLGRLGRPRSARGLSAAPAPDPHPGASSATHLGHLPKACPAALLLRLLTTT